MHASYRQEAPLGSVLVNIFNEVDVLVCLSKLWLSLGVEGDDGGLGPQRKRTKVSRLEEHEKEVVSALRYFKTIVDKMVVEKKVLEMLPGSASKVLEAILPLVQVEARIQHSSALSSCHNRVYQSLANLIRWADQVMLDGIDLEDKENVASVTSVIKAVLDGVKELVKLTIEKQEQPSPTTPNKPAPPATTTAESMSSEMPLIDREQEVSSKTAPAATPAEAASDIPDEDVAPPKPPLPEAKMAGAQPSTSTSPKEASVSTFAYTGRSGRPNEPWLQLALQRPQTAAGLRAGVPPEAFLRREPVLRGRLSPPVSVQQHGEA
ncbi:Rap guanine nucleotide exchange factor 1 [Larimichthys crocea]|uniref:Uncharacterized protein n=1 Tax=Larimichthys crocea TaxID=215358 RepID=A0ACD3QNB1_LARCR|nr:Rap guanine nucleotide exchange factor 1 [Larimichthys crocea]